MNKHDIAMEVLRRARDGYRDAEYRDACGYAMRILEAVEMVEEWMPKLMWNECYDETATALQAIIDAKAEG